jgi:hypothetical protein
VGEDRGPPRPDPARREELGEEAAWTGTLRMPGQSPGCAR